MGYDVAQSIARDILVRFDAGEFDADRDAVIERAARAGVVVQVIPALTASTFNALAELCRGRHDLFAAYGLHPIYLDQHGDNDIDVVRDMILRGGAIAIGECGLDFFVAGLDPDRQRRLFDAQLKLAREFELPLILQ